MASWDSQRQCICWTHFFSEAQCLEIPLQSYDVCFLCCNKLLCDSEPGLISNIVEDSCCSTLSPRGQPPAQLSWERHHVALQGCQGHGRLVSPQLGRGGGGRRGRPPTSLLSRGQPCPCTEGKFNFPRRMLDLKESSQTINIYPFWVV